MPGLMTEEYNFIVYLHSTRDSVLKKPIGNISLIEQNGGFTLLEIVVALSIISIVLISIYKMQTQTITMNNWSKFYSTAPLLAQRKLTDIRTSGLRLSSDSGDCGKNFPGYNWSVTISNPESDILGSATQYLKKIDILVTFNKTEFSYNLRTYMAFWE